MSIATVLEKDSVRNLILPLSVEQYHRMNEIGLIPPKTELIEGIIIRKITKSPSTLTYCMCSTVFSPQGFSQVIQ